ncbi:MAG: putative concanavalin A-like lectin/glucanases superfamily protein [Prokaryotic dsDNA virus sp.]|jgi:hypothetical protein|nr:MAG: putative concanavalin A-like lectin/glucanases superfamily protein [Prokaryotic dsDNA virus sp.]|tara:strand:+ start:22612 stop:24663 length:2052 start_codon:yes stop_codon:yes gene_type:complete
MGILQQKITSGDCVSFVDFRSFTSGDFSENNNEGTINGNPVFNKEGLVFDGTGDYVNFGNLSELNFSTNDFSIIYGIKTNIAAAVDVLAKRNGITNIPGFIIGVAATGRAFFEIDDGAGNELNGSCDSIDINDGIIHWVVITFDRSGDAIFYVDGIEDGNDTISAVGDIDNAVDYLIGRNAAGSRQFPGTVVAVGAFNTLLTATEAAQLTADVNSMVFPTAISKRTHTKELTDNRENLIGLWYMKTQGLIVADSQESSHELTIQDNPIEVNTEILGDSLMLDGTDDYLSATDVADLSFGDGSSDSAFSIAAWVKMRDATQFPIVSKGVLNTDFEYLLRTGPADTLQVFYADESVANCYIGREYSTALTIVEGSWLHIVSTYSGDGTSSDVTLYINGVQVDDSDNELNAGSYVAMEDLAGELRIGRYNTDYAGGSFAEVGIFNVELDQEDITKLYHKGARQVQFKTDFGAYVTQQNVTDGYIGNTIWQRSTGTWKIESDVIDNRFVKVLECVSAGIAYTTVKELFMESAEAAFGTWEFWLYKGADGNTCSLQIMADEIGLPDAAGQDGYEIRLNSLEQFVFRKSTNGTPSILMSTANSYISNETWYGFKIVRRFDGQFTVYIKGGAFGGSWTIVDTSGGSGSNPVTDTTTTSSSYVVFDFDAGDKLAIADGDGGHAFIKYLGVI